MRTILLGSVAALLAAGSVMAQPAQPPQPAPRPAAMCASADQAKLAMEYYAKTPGMLPPNAARALKMPEAAMISGLPKDQVAVVSGAEFVKIWDTMTAWPKALGLVMKGGNVFEIAGKVMPGEQSTRSNFYNIKPGGGIYGHLRPDLLASIAVAALPGKDGAVTRGVLFYDGAGESSFAVFTVGDGGEGSAPSAAGVAAFDKTLALAKSLPKACS
jgi:putative heme iron utilization protein